MKNFLLVYRSDSNALPKPDRSPEELQATMKLWMDWIGGIAAQNKLVDRGNSLTNGGKVVKPNQVITDGPYMEIKEVIGGFSIIKAESMEEAADMCQGCPIIAIGGNVEVREMNQM